MWTSKIYVYICTYTYPCKYDFEQVRMYFDFIRMHSSPVTNKETHNCKRYDSTGYHRDWIPVLSTLTIRFQFISLAGGKCHIFPASVLRSGNLTPVLLSTQHTTIKHPKSSYQHHSHRIHVWYIYLHVVDFYDKCSLIFHTWILWDSQTKNWTSLGHFRSHTA